MLKGVLADTWYFFRNHVVVISAIMLPVVVPTEILTKLFQYAHIGKEAGFPELALPVALGFITYPIYMIGIIFYIASVVAGEPVAIKTLWQQSLKYWFPFMALTLMVSLVMIAGFMLLIIPGIIANIRYAFAEFELLFNQRRPLDAMAKSWQDTREYAWVILGGFAIITIILNVPFYLIDSVLDNTGASHWVLEILLSIVYSVLSVFYTIFAFRVYEFAKAGRDQSSATETP